MRNNRAAPDVLCYFAKQQSSLIKDLWKFWWIFKLNSNWLSTSIFDSFFLISFPFLGAPFPPTSLQLSSDCQNRNTTLSWVTGESNNASILYFLIERKSQYADDFWQVIANVTNPNATSHPLVNLAGYADLEFRVRAVNRFGPSRPSEPTGSLCRTLQAGS